jgi:hypothetical protein
MRGTGGAYREYFEANQALLALPEGRIVLAMRFKMMLLRYLFDVPACFGFRPWSPFLDPEVALAMLRLPAARRKNRVWQRDIFRREGIDMESMSLGGSYEIKLSRTAVDEMPLAALDPRRLNRLLTSDYVSHINRRVAGVWPRRFYDHALRIRNNLLDVPYLNAVLYRMGLRERVDGFDAAYSAYMTLWPLDRLFHGERRDRL